MTDRTIRPGDPGGARPVQPMPADVTGGLRVAPSPTEDVAVDVPGAAEVLGITEEQVRDLMDAGVLTPVAPSPETPGHRDQSANCEHGDHDDCAAMVECEAEDHGLHDCGCACHTLTERSDGTFAYPPGHFTAMASPETPGLREAAEALVRRTDGLTVHFTGGMPYLVVKPEWLDALRAALRAPSPETPGPLTDWDTGYVHAIRDHDECCGTLRNHRAALDRETPA